MTPPTRRFERRKLDLPDRRQHTYEELAKQLDAHTVEVERRLHRFFKKALFIFAVIGITSAVALLGFTLVLGEIKKTRRDFVEVLCKEQNRRHDKTIAKFKSASAEAIKRTPKFAKEIEASVQDNLEIIDALAPKQDCKKLGDVAVGDAKPPPPTIPSTPPAANKARP